MDERIEELLDAGYELREVITYEIIDPSGHTITNGADEDECWRRVIQDFDRERVRFAKQKLARWNAAVKGKA